MRTARSSELRARSRSPARRGVNVKRPRHPSVRADSRSIASRECASDSCRSSSACIGGALAAPAPCARPEGLAGDAAEVRFDQTCQARQSTLRPRRMHPQQHNQCERQNDERRKHRHLSPGDHRFRLLVDRLRIGVMFVHAQASRMRSARRVRSPGSDNGSARYFRQRILKRLTAPQWPISALC